LTCSIPATLDLGQLRADMPDWQRHLAGAAPRSAPVQIAARKPHPEESLYPRCSPVVPFRKPLLESVRVKSSSSRPRTATPESVPLLDLRRRYESIRDDVLAAIARVCDSQRFFLGPESKRWSGKFPQSPAPAPRLAPLPETEALWLALVGAGVKPGDSVITGFQLLRLSQRHRARGATPILEGCRSRQAQSQPGACGAALGTPSCCRQHSGVSVPPLVFLRPET
jgi:hypothetical protein